jgi:homocysteine S-methyltransferase
MAGPQKSGNHRDPSLTWKIRISNVEIRNKSERFVIGKSRKPLGGRFSNFKQLEFVSDFDIRISNFRFPPLLFFSARSSPAPIFSPMDFLDELQAHILPGDSAMGTALLAAGAPADACLEELCVSRPELVREIHAQAIAAGARLIRTNSFGANTARLGRKGHEHRVSEINWSAAQLAKDVAKGTGVQIAGSVGPLGIGAAEAEARGIDRQAAFTEQIGALLDGGARVIFLETFLDLDELLLAIYVKQSLHHCPVIASLACPDDGVLPDGTPLADAFAKLRAADADIVGLNCVRGPFLATRLLANAGDPGPIAVFPSAGLPVERDGRLEWPATPEDFARAMPDLMASGAGLIGGCCGTTPAHIAAIVAALAPFEEEPAS